MSEDTMAKGRKCIIPSDLAVVIPAFNAALTIITLIDELVHFGFERKHIFVINDGSTDHTADVLEGSGVIVVTHPENRGKGAALQTGLQAARLRGFSCVMMLDADGQHRVCEIKHFLKKQNFFDLILGVRSHDGAMPVLRKVVNRVTSLVISLLAGSHVPDVQSGFRFMHLEIMDDIVLRTRNYQTESELVYQVLRHGYQIGFVPVNTIYNDQKSHIHPIYDTLRFISMAVRFLWR